MFHLGVLLCLCLVLEVLSSQSYYKTLGVKPQATDKDIKKAYRKLAMKVNQPYYIKIYLI